MRGPSVKFTVYGTPQPGGSKRAFVRGKHASIVDANPKAKGWKSQVAQTAGEIMDGRPLLDGALFVSLRFYRARPKGHFNSRGELNAKGRRTPYPTTKPDTTKLVRSTEDALKGVIWRDDSYVVEQSNGKEWGTPERVEIEVWELVPPEGA